MPVETQTRAPRDVSSFARNAPPYAPGCFPGGRPPASSIRWSFATLASSVNFFSARLLLPRAHFDTRSTRASDDIAAVQYFGNGTDAFSHRRRAGFARNPPATPFDGNPTRPVFVFVPHRATASDHFPPTRPTRSCQGVRGRGGCCRLGPRPHRRCRLEGTPETCEIRTPTRSRWPAAPSTSTPADETKKYRTADESRRLNPGLT